MADVRRRARPARRPRGRRREEDDDERPAERAREDRVEVAAPAKLNLALLVGPVRPDGFHEIASLMLPVTLADRVIVERTPGAGLDVVCDVAPGEDNLAARLVRELEERLDRAFEVRVTIEKRVPHGGGLGGGSSDAAATLLALERLFDLDLSPQAALRRRRGRGLRRALLPLARAAARHGPRPGAQGGGAAGAAPRGRHAGRRPEHGGGLRLARRGRGGDAQGVRAAGAAALERVQAARTVKDVAALVANDLEPSVVRAQRRRSRELLERLRSAGALAAAMTGSGAAVFGIFATEARARGAGGASPPPAPGTSPTCSRSRPGGRRPSGRGKPPA